MAKRTIDTKAWLGEIGFTEAEITELLPRFESRSDKLAEMQMRQSDYDKSFNELKTTKSSLEAAEAKLNGEMAEWAELTAAEKAAAGDLKKKLDASEAKIFSLTQKMTRLAEDAGVDPKTVLGDEPVVKPVVKEPIAFDPAPLEKQIGGVAEYMMTLNADLPFIAQEHYELTGERFDSRAFIAGIKEDIKTGNKKAILDPVQRWEAAHQIPEKRKAKADEAIEARVKRERAEERTAVLSEAALPNAQVRTGTHGPVFTRPSSTTASKLQRPQPGARTGAASALASGKYAGGQQKTA